MIMLMTRSLRDFGQAALPQHSVGNRDEAVGKLVRMQEDRPEKVILTVRQAELQLLLLRDVVPLHQHCIFAIHRILQQ